jgi:hypothetical protein
MKIKDILIEDNVTNLQTSIISQVKKTKDEDMLQRIFTVLNKSGLVGRISSVLSRDTDTHAYLNMLTNIIVETPGTYEEKDAFVKGYPKGYINIPLMISGQMVAVSDLITGIKGTPIEFVKRVFYALAGSKNDKGPGELALAVLSPLIMVSGKGDLKIGKLNIEVKAVAPPSVENKKPGGGGRLGETGGKDLAYEKTPAILEKYTKKDYSAVNAKVSDIPTILQDIKDPAGKIKCAQEVLNYIFKGRVNVNKMAKLAASGQNIILPFFIANYDVYKQRHGFTSLMILDFTRGYCRNYTDPAVMFDDIGLPNPYITGPHVDRGSVPQLTFKKIRQ